jgi:hypothetical protein
MPEDALLPLIFLDVDGTVLPFAREPVAEPRTGVSDALAAGLSASLGLRLAALPGRLVWATAWENDANLEISPRIGLPELPVVIWPEPADEHVAEDDWFGLHWKTRALVAWAQGRDFVWVDDEITDADREWVARVHPGRALLHLVDAARGLSDQDFAALDDWPRGLR